VSNIYRRKPIEATYAPSVPAQVLMSWGEIAESAKQGLLALAVGAGIQVMYAMMDADVAVLAGPKGSHDRDRAAVRHGNEDASVTLGERRIAVRLARVPTPDESAEVAVPARELFSSTEVLGRLTLERMLAGLSTRHYGHGLEPVGEQVAAAATSTSRSAISRRFVAATERALTEVMAADLSGPDLVAVVVDGVGFAEYLCVVALGIGIDGTKRSLALVEGSSENANPGPRFAGRVTASAART
jgi:putative transposase